MDTSTESEKLVPDKGRIPGMTYVSHLKKHGCDVYIGRPSEFGNPFTHISDKETKAEFVVSSRKEAIQKYEDYLHSSGLINKLDTLKGKILGCWCVSEIRDGSNKNPVCHGEVIAKILNQEFFSKQKKLF
jgi:hypothetical protein